MDDPHTETVEAIQRKINSALANEAPGRMGVDAERMVDSHMPDGWEWLTLECVSRPPQIRIVRT